MLSLFSKLAFGKMAHLCPCTFDFFVVLHFFLVLLKDNRTSVTTSCLKKCFIFLSQLVICDIRLIKSVKRNMTWYWRS